MLVLVVAAAITISSVSAGLLPPMPPPIPDAGGSYMYPTPSPYAYSQPPSYPPQTPPPSYSTPPPSYSPQTPPPSYTPPSPPPAYQSSGSDYGYKRECKTYYETVHVTILDFNFIGALICSTDVLLVMGFNDPVL